MARINSYTKITGAPADSDCFIIDSTQGTAGTRIVLWSVLKSVLTGIFAPKVHKHPGSDITSAVANANAATNDSIGQNLASTYVKELTVDGRTITVKRGNNTTFAFQTQDTNTTYPVADATHSGIMSSADKRKLDGLPTNIVGAIPLASQSVNGLMSSADKRKLDGLSSDVAGSIPLATPSIDGLMPKADKAKLDAIGPIPTSTIDGFFRI